MRHLPLIPLVLAATLIGLVPAGSPAWALAPDASPTTSAAGTEHPPLDLAVMALMADEPDAARAAAEDLAVQQTA
jgi:hypothetical protein